jgi:protocatechuate 3,4-dioxygenase, beta subunit
MNRRMTGCGSRAPARGLASAWEAALGAWLLVAAGVGKADAAQPPQAPTPAATEEKSEERPWMATIAPASEPGQRLVVSGIVRAADGKTALAGVDLYVYHTDVAGLYNRESRDSRNPRLQVRLRTRADGRYEFRTIKPGPYPQGGTPAHVHFVLSQPGHKEQYFEIFFEGDPYLDEKSRRLAQAGQVCTIVTPTQDEAGTLHASCDITYREVEPGEAASGKR